MGDAGEGGGGSGVGELERAARAYAPVLARQLARRLLEGEGVRSSFDGRGPWRAPPTEGSFRQSLIESGILPRPYYSPADLLKVVV